LIVLIAMDWLDTFIRDFETFNKPTDSTFEDLLVKFIPQKVDHLVKIRLGVKSKEFGHRIFYLRIYNARAIQRQQSRKNNIPECG
jgi:hypothetical protein